MQRSNMPVAHLVVGAALALGLSGAAFAQQAAVPSADPAAAVAEAASGYAAQKVVYYINGGGGDAGEAYRGALNNIRNHLDAVGDDNIDLRVVMHGNGLELLSFAKTNANLQNVVAGLKSRGVRFLVCNNTVTAREIDVENDLYDVWPEDIVPSGVAELGKLQGEGFGYIKP